MKNGNLISALGNSVYTRKAMVLLVGFILTCSLFLAVISAPATAANGNLTLYAPETSDPPTLDGILDPGEWSDAIHYRFFFVPSSTHPSDYIDIFLMSGSYNLYIAFDVQPDNTSEIGDEAYVALDLNNNGTQDFVLYQNRQMTANSVKLNGTNCSNLSWGVAFGFNTSPQETGRNHTIIEISLGVNPLISYISQDASTLTHLAFGVSPVGVILGGYGTLTPTWVYGNSSAVVNLFDTDASMYADLYLGSPPDQPFPWWIIALAIGLPAIAAVAVILFLRKRKKEA